MTEPRTGRPGMAALTLLLILLITAAWWALALWPAGPVEPEWLARTRATCFGSVAGGLPDAGGWILLIGEPIGMVVALMAVWGTALKEDFRRIGADRRWRLVAGAVAGAVLLGVTAAGRRVAYAEGFGTPITTTPYGVPTPVDYDLGATALTDQHGARVTVAAASGGPALLTFAFGHCTTICETIVHDVRAARAAAGKAEVPLLVITLDPWRDTPSQLPSLAAHWRLEPQDRVLSGTVAEVESLLDQLGVTRQRNETTGDIVHVGTVMALDDRGHVVSRLDGGWGRVPQLLAGMPSPPAGVSAGSK